MRTCSYSSSNSQVFWPFQPAARASGRSAERARDGAFVVRGADTKRTSVNLVPNGFIVTSRREIARHFELLTAENLRPFGSGCKARSVAVLRYLPGTGDRQTFPRPHH